jgi:hypothetical protein
MFIGGSGKERGDFTTIAALMSLGTGTLTRILPAEDVRGQAQFRLWRDPAAALKSSAIE